MSRHDNSGLRNQAIGTAIGINATSRWKRQQHWNDDRSSQRPNYVASPRYMIHLEGRSQLRLPDDRGWYSLSGSQLGLLNRISQIPLQRLNIKACFPQNSVILFVLVAEDHKTASIALTCVPRTRTPSNAEPQFHLHMMARSFYMPFTWTRTVQGDAVVRYDKTGSASALRVKNKCHDQSVQTQNLAENEDQNHSHENPRLLHIWSYSHITNYTDRITRSESGQTDT